jgi:hypothetical protein
MRQFKTASAAAAAVSRHQDGLVDVDDGCKVDGASGWVGVWGFRPAAGVGGWVPKWGFVGLLMGWVG